MDEQQAVGPVRVVYESEPRDHGAAARALPSISTGFLRGVFAKLLRTSDDLNAFALDYFSAVHRQFSSGMTREAREDLLLAGVPSLAVYEALRASFGSKVPPPPSQADTRTMLPNPYRGLLVFGVKDAPLFFGRAKKTAELRRLFDAAVLPPSDAGPVPPRLVAVIGPSGSGKSSLAQAGLLADLLRKPPVGVSYVAAVLRPQGRPLRALARVLAKLKQPTTEWPLGQIDSIVERLRSGPGALGDLVSDVLTEPEQRLLLVVDQLEELYSMAEESEAGTAERRAFVAAVLVAASERRGRLDVVVTQRADLLGEVEADPQLQTALTTTGRALLLGALDAEELAEAVAGPAARAGRPLPPDAVALLVREAEGQAGALPLLQFTLEKLWKAIDDAPTRPIAELLGELGGVGGALANEAESLYRGLHPAWPKSEDSPAPSPSAAQVRARRTFSRLLQTRDGQVLGRRRQTLSDLVGDGEKLADVRAVLDRFVASRLLVLDGEGAEAMVEIGHESLERSWQRLAQWLSEAAAYLPVVLRLSEDTRRWQKQGQPGWLLWRGDDLAVLRRALPAIEGNGDLGAGERCFALASVRGARRRQVLAVGGVLTLVGALVGVGTLALWAQEQAKQARKQTQVAQQRLIQAVGVADHVVFNVNGQLEREPGMADLRKGLLAEAMKMLDELRKEAGANDDRALLRTRSVGHLQRGDLAMTHDNLTLARSEYGAALQIAEVLAARRVDFEQEQSDVASCAERLGDVSMQMGNLGEAKAWFERSQKLREALIRVGDSAQAWSDLSSTMVRLGEVAVRLGQLGDAKTWFERSVSIYEKLAQSDVAQMQGGFNATLHAFEKFAGLRPKSIDTERSLALTLTKVGDVALQMGRLGEAKTQFARALQVSEQLARSDGNSARTLRELSICQEKQGDVAMLVGRPAEAKIWFGRSLKIREQLADADAHDARAQYDLSISMERQGEVAVQLGQLGEAKAWFERSMKIRVKLADADANSAEAQHALSVSAILLGRVAVQMGQLGEAKAWFERSLKINEKLAQAAPNSAQAQREVSTSLYHLGEVAVQMRQLVEAKAWLERSLKISEKLAQAAPNSAQAQRDLSVNLNQLAEVAVQMGQSSEAKAWFERSLEIFAKLAQANASDMQAQRDLIFSHYKLADLFSRSRQPSAARTQARLAADLLNQLRPRLPKHDADNLDQSIRALLR